MVGVFPRTKAAHVLVVWLIDLLCSVGPASAQRCNLYYKDALSETAGISIPHPLSTHVLRVARFEADLPGLGLRSEVMVPRFAQRPGTEGMNRELFVSRYGRFGANGERDPSLSSNFLDALPMEVPESLLKAEPSRRLPPDLVEMRDRWREGLLGRALFWKEVLAFGEDVKRVYSDRRPEWRKWLEELELSGIEHSERTIFISIFQGRERVATLRVIVAPYGSFSMHDFTGELRKPEFWLRNEGRVSPIPPQFETGDWVTAFGAFGEAYERFYDLPPQPIRFNTAVPVLPMEAELGVYLRRERGVNDGRMSAPGLDPIYVMQSGGLAIELASWTVSRKLAQSDPNIVPALFAHGIRIIESLTEGVSTVIGAVSTSKALFRDFSPKAISDPIEIGGIDWVPMQISKARLLNLASELETADRWTPESREKLTHFLDHLGEFRYYR